VTCRHIAEQLEDAPFIVRVNRHRSGGSNILQGDNIKWTYHPDENIDLAAIEFFATLGNGYECLFFPDRIFATNEILSSHYIDVGDLCYSVGLFRYVTGTNKNLPVVLTGNIALWTDDKIPMWNNAKTRSEYVEGRLIQSQGIHGSSGSPVFVRPGMEITELPGPVPRITVLNGDVFLLGVFQGAWFLPPDAMLRAELGANTGDSVPVGLGSSSLPPN
jgi:hypothetical protein